jgi:hypothetical protein
MKKKERLTIGFFQTSGCDMYNCFDDLDDREFAGD